MVLSTYWNFYIFSFNSVIPAKAGIQFLFGCLDFLDADFRRHDEPGNGLLDTSFRRKPESSAGEWQSTLCTEQLPWIQNGWQCLIAAL
jgi:hypothetical protein